MNLVTLYCRARKQNKFYQYVICGHKSQPGCSETDPWATMTLDQFKRANPIEGHIGKVLLFYSL